MISPQSLRIAIADSLMQGSTNRASILRHRLESQKSKLAAMALEVRRTEQELGLAIQSAENMKKQIEIELMLT